MYTIGPINYGPRDITGIMIISTVYFVFLGFVVWNKYFWVTRRWFWTRDQRILLLLCCCFNAPAYFVGTPIGYPSAVRCAYFVFSLHRLPFAASAVSEQRQHVQRSPSLFFCISFVCSHLPYVRLLPLLVLVLVLVLVVVVVALAMLLLLLWLVVFTISPLYCAVVSVERCCFYLSLCCTVVRCSSRNVPSTCFLQDTLALGVFDGHSGSGAAHFAQEKLLGHIQVTLVGDLRYVTAVFTGTIVDSTHGAKKNFYVSLFLHQYLVLPGYLLWSPVIA